MEESNSRLGIHHCFTLCDADKHIVAAAPSSRELTKWLGDLQKTANLARSKNQVPLNSTDLSSLEYSDEIQESVDISEEIIFPREEKQGNTTIHICWHRNLSISQHDLLLAMKSSLSGYLLRKFKNNSGWQKVWVVLGNLCLFFYRSYVDESPLASLPLAGYRFSETVSTDLVSGECIFKLTFKTHEYFFMAENRHTFERWMNAINMCTLLEVESTRL